MILTTHFANADEPQHSLNTQQINTFLALKQQLEPIEASMCNSAAIINWPQLHFNWVRPGIMLYGSSPFAHTTGQAQDAAHLGLKPALTLKSSVIAIHHLQAGEFVGYGSLWQAPQNCSIAVVGIGYGDGYPRVINNAFAQINQTLAPIVGRVSMDMLMLDVSCVSAQVGDEVLLWGSALLSVDDVASSANTIGYELLCRLTQRPKRVSVEP